MQISSVGGSCDVATDEFSAESLNKYRHIREAIPQPQETVNFPQQIQQGSSLNFDAQINRPINIFLENPGTQPMPEEPLQSSGGILAGLEALLKKLMAELQAFIDMASGKASESDPSVPSQISSPSVSGGGATSAPGPAAVNNANVQIADTSLNTTDPDLQKLVNRFGNQYEAASKETGVPAKLLAAVTMQESGGDTGATSTNPGNGKTDTGMNQINPDTYAGMRAEHPDKLGADMTDPKNQIMCTALMLKEGKEKFGTYDAALRAYNSGDDQVDMNNLSHVTLGDPNYVNEVNTWMAKFK